MNGALAPSVHETNDQSPPQEPLYKPAVLGLDLGTYFAWSVVMGGAPVEFDTWIYEKKRGASPGLRWLKFIRFFEELLVDVIRRYKRLVLVGYEQPFLRGGYANDVLIGYQENIKTVCSKLDLEFMPIQVNTLKKYATGNGAAPKAAMRAALNYFMRRKSLRLGRGANEHEVDAMWAGLYTWAFFKGEVP